MIVSGVLLLTGNLQEPARLDELRIARSCLIADVAWLVLIRS